MKKVIGDKQASKTDKYINAAKHSKRSNMVKKSSRKKVANAIV